MENQEEQEFLPDSKSTVLDAHNDIISQHQAVQSLGKGFIAGLVAAIIGAILWGLITSATGYKIGYAAIGIGFIVGFAIRVVGRGIDMSFSYMGAGLALFGCLFGNILAIAFIVQTQASLTFGETMSLVYNPTFIQAALTEGFDPIDLLFYGIAAYEGFKFSRIDLYA